MELSEETKRDLMEFQNGQQQLQMVLMQKQQAQMQAAENKKVELELEGKTGEAYRYYGSVLIAKKPEEISKELKHERETLEMRLGLLEKQEAKLSERLMAIESKFKKMQESMTGGQGAGNRHEGASGRHEGASGRPSGEGASVSGSGVSITKRNKTAG